MRCLLEGHKPVQHPGVGEFKGQTFTICSVCGKTMDGNLGEFEGFTQTTVHTQFYGRKPEGRR